jgi:hypothetical protein
MPETVSQTASLIGQVIEDVTYGALSPHAFDVQLGGVNRPPQYKDGGFFVFSDVRPGVYRLRIVGEGYQPQEHMVAVPLEPIMFASPPLVDLPPLFDSPPYVDALPAFETFPIFEQPGDNELVVMVSSIDSSTDVMTFDPVILRKEIRAGALVLAPGFATRLRATLDVGRATRASLGAVAGLSTASIVRIIRGRSIRLKFDPYHPVPFAHTRIVGKVVRQDAPEVSLPGAQVRLTRVNNAHVVLHEIVGATVAAVTVGATATVLGTERDVVTLTNDQGDYHLYFTGDFFADVTLEVTLARYQTQVKTNVVALNQRNIIDFQLLRS